MFNKILLLSIFLLIPTSVQAASDISINQILPNPENEDDEWIELKNLSTSTQDISNFVIDDETNGGSKPYKIPSQTQIESGATLKFYKSQTGVILNNSKQKDQNYADQVNLFNSSGELIDQLTYVATSTNETISKNLPPTPTQVIKPTNTPTPANTPIPTNTLKPTSVQPQVLAVTTAVSPTIILQKSPLPQIQLSSTTKRLSNSDSNPSLLNTEKTSRFSSSMQVITGVISIVIGLSLLFLSLLKASKKLNFSL